MTSAVLDQATAYIAGRGLVHLLRPETAAAAMPVKVQLAALAAPAPAALADQQHVLAPRALVEHHRRREMYFKAACAQAFACYFFRSASSAFVSLARHVISLPIPKSPPPRYAYTQRRLYPP